MAFDPEALAAKILELLQDAALRRKLGNQGRKIAQSYDWVNITRQMIAVYEDVAER